jgi:hypothetical protein
MDSSGKYTAEIAETAEVENQSESSEAMRIMQRPE